MKTKTDIRDRFVIIMAGGRGERFWPLSREKTPKQLLTLLGKRSFLQQAVDRVLPLVPLKNIFIITNQAQAAAVRKQLPKLPKDNVVAEPIGRDTCAAVALGAALVGARSTTGIMAVLPADHVIPGEAEFQQVLTDAFTVAAWAWLVMMKMFLSGTRGSTRSTACWRNERLPSSVSSCLGVFSRLSGQKRSPRPPAMMTTK